MAFLRNTWYVAAWGHEVGDDFFVRKILGDAVLMYRTAAGTVAAVADRCPHRFAPLHVGRRVGDRVECGYHGLQFNALGECVLNPHGQQVIPKTLNVRSFPLVERHGALWIWPGVPELADPSRIPDFGYLTEETRKTLFGSILVRANYELINDNVMDASHSGFVHRELTGTGALDPGNYTVSHEEGKSVDSNSLFPGVVVPDVYKAYFKNPNEIVDRTLNFHWVPPSLMLVRDRFVPVDPTVHDGIERVGTHCLTPETETTTHYLFAHTRNYRLDDASLDEATRRWQRLGIDGQDRPMIEAVQESMGTTALDSLHPALLSADAAAVRVRRILASLVDQEHISRANGQITEPIGSLT